MTHTGELHSCRHRGTQLELTCTWVLVPGTRTLQSIKDRAQCRHLGVKNMASNDRVVVMSAAKLVVAYTYRFTQGGAPYSA